MMLRENQKMTSKSVRPGLAVEGDLPAVNEINRQKDLKFNIADCKFQLLLYQKNIIINY